MTQTLVDILQRVGNALDQKNIQILGAIPQQPKPTEMGGKQMPASLGSIQFGKKIFPAQPFYYPGPVYYEQLQAVASAVQEFGVSTLDYAAYQKLMILTSTLSQRMRVDEGFFPQGNYVSGIDISVLATLTGNDLERAWAEVLVRNPALGLNIFNSDARLIQEMPLNSQLSHFGVIRELTLEEQIKLIIAGDSSVPHPLSNEASLNLRDRWNATVYEEAIMHNVAVSCRDIPFLLNAHAEKLFVMNPGLHFHNAYVSYQALPAERRDSAPGRLQGKFYADTGTIERTPIKRMYGCDAIVADIDAAIEGMVQRGTGTIIPVPNFILTSNSFRCGKTMLLNYMKRAARGQGISLIDIDTITSSEKKTPKTPMEYVGLLRQVINLCRGQASQDGVHYLIVGDEKLGLFKKGGDPDVMAALKELFDGNGTNSFGVSFALTGNLTLEEIDPAFRQLGRAKIYDMTPTIQSRRDVAYGHLNHLGLSVPETDVKRALDTTLADMNHLEIITAIDHYAQAAAASPDFRKSMIELCIGQPYLPGQEMTQKTMYCAALALMARSLGKQADYITVGGLNTGFSPKVGFSRQTAGTDEVVVEYLCKEGALQTIKESSARVERIDMRVDELETQAAEAFQRLSVRFSRAEAIHYVTQVIKANPQAMAQLKDSFAAKGVIYYDEMGFPCNNPYSTHKFGLATMVGENLADVVEIGFDFAGWLVSGKNPRIASGLADSGLRESVASELSRWYQKTALGPDMRVHEHVIRFNAQACRQH